MEKVFHLGLNRDDLQGATLAIVPGDPDRSARISEQLENPRCLVRTREFHAYLGTLSGQSVVICSTGICEASDWRPPSQEQRSCSVPKT